MHTKQARAITRNPKAAMRFHMTGKVPRLVTPQSPLITLLETYTPRDRLQMVGVRLLPNLGYTGGMTFRNAEQLYRWLKPAPQMLEGECWPAESRRIKRFQKRLTEDELIQSCAQWPEWLKAKHELASKTDKGTM